ncbi:MAG: exodeoxyribonuclease V subunit gamma, partial [Clostridiales bacterium]|nr:exodeoxyribonuclease V subunit gamma [Clostridiales bacterium]
SSFYSPATPIKKGVPKDIYITESPGVYKEVYNCAGSIIRLCREKGYIYSDIAVAARNVEDYENIIRSVFTQYNIPFFIDVKRDLEEHVFIRLILSALDIMSDDFQYRHVFDYLKTGLLPLSVEQVDKLENFVLANGIRGRKMWERDFGPLEEVKRTFLAPFDKILPKIKGIRSSKAGLNGILGLFYDFLISLELPSKIVGYKDEKIESDFIRVWNIVMEVFDQIYNFLGFLQVGKEGIDSLKTLLFNAFAQYKIGYIPTSADCVNVGSVERSKNREIKALIVLGVNEGIFPASFTDNGLLSDIERKELTEAGIWLADDSTARAFQEQFMIYRTLTAPTEYLEICYSLQNMEGKSLRPSTIVKKLLRLFPDLKISVAPVKYKKSDILNCMNSPDAFLAEMSGEMMKTENIAVGENTPEGKLWSDIHYWYSRSPEYRSTYGKILKYSKGLVFDIKIDRESAMDIFEGNTVSVSRVELYNKCPFSYYLRYGLVLQPRLERKYNLPDAGIFLHSLIEKFSREIMRMDGTLRGISKEKCERLTTGLVHEILTSNSGFIEDSNRSRFLLDRLSKMAVDSVVAISTQIDKGEFEPQGFEYDLPSTGIYIEDLAKKYQLKGRVDRFDCFDSDNVEYLRIVDYKSGDRDIKPLDIVSGLSLQLICYIDAISKALSRKKKLEVIPAGIFYFKLDDPVIRLQAPPETQGKNETKYKMNGLVLKDENILKAMDRDIGRSSTVIPASLNREGEASGDFCVPKDGFRLLAGSARKVISETVGKMLMGNIPILPYKYRNNTQCNFCDYKIVCGFNEKNKNCLYRQIKFMTNDEIWELLSRDSTDTAQ